MIDVDRGRLFVRRNLQGVAVIGVLEMPAELPAEHIYGCGLLNGRLRLDLASSESGVSRGGYMGVSDLCECSANDVLTSLTFRHGPGDTQELFVRQSVLPSSAPGMRWCLVMGARPSPLEAMREDGLYELVGGPDFRRVATPPEFGKGLSIGQVLREPLWGPSGAYGLAHSLEPGCYPEWVVRERERRANQDPRFREFMRRMESGAQPLYYTRWQQEEWDARMEAALREMIRDDDGMEDPREKSNRPDTHGIG